MAVLLASRDDINRRFIATRDTWPTGAYRIIKYRLVKGQGDRHFPKGFLATYGQDFANICFAIDHCDNCLPIELSGHFKNRAIEEKTFERMRDVYGGERDATVTLQYVGYGIFFLSLWDKLNYELALAPNPKYYVGDYFPRHTLELIEAVFNIRYSQEVEQPEVVSISSDSEDSEVGSSSGYSSCLTHWKELSSSDIQCGMLYIPSEFARELHTFGDGAVWTIVCPPSPHGQCYRFKAHINPTNPFDIRFGVEWGQFCKDHNLKPRDILQFGILSGTNLIIVMAFDRH